MPFTDTSRNIRLDGATLHADCRVAPGSDKYKTSHLALDNIIGVVDGQLRWGYRNFSQNAKNIKLDGSQLSADVKTVDGKFVTHKLDLNSNIHNNKGSLEGLNIHRPVTPAKGHAHQDSSVTKSPELKIDLSKAKASNGVTAANALSTSISDLSMSTSSSLFSSASAASSATSMHSVKTETFAESSYSETKTSFEMGSSVQLSIRTTCKNVKLKGTVLSAHCFHSSSREHVYAILDLNTCIGFDNGKLFWGGSNFSSKCEKIELKNWVLVVTFEDKAGHHHETVLELWECIHNIDGKLRYIEVMNAKFSAMLSEVPWMKFRVIAEPDMSVFASHPVLKTTMARIAQSTVEHVTMQMEEKITKAITEAISSVTVSAMTHIQKSLEVMVQEVAFGGGKAHIHGSATATEELHILREGDRYFEAVNYGHHHHHDHHDHHGNGYGNGIGNGNGNGAGAGAGYMHTHFDYQVQEVSSENKVD
ncbi:CVNH domain-containing protein [Cyathus striatus]|nr:CVNH domain-containing protein [Cyathus striatus]